MKFEVGDRVYYRKGFKCTIVGITKNIINGCPLYTLELDGDNRITINKDVITLTDECYREKRLKGLLDEV
jgi:hypothetical protein